MVILPEAWPLPYATKFFPEFAEEVPEVGESVTGRHPSTKLLSDLSSNHKIFIVGGSLAEKATNGRIYNTCVVTDPSGQIVARHRKVGVPLPDTMTKTFPGRRTFSTSTSQDA